MMQIWIARRPIFQWIVRSVLICKKQKSQGILPSSYQLMNSQKMDPSKEADCLIKIFLNYWTIWLPYTAAPVTRIPYKTVSMMDLPVGSIIPGDFAIDRSVIPSLVHVLMSWKYGSIFVSYVLFRSYLYIPPQFFHQKAAYLTRVSGLMYFAVVKDHWKNEILFKCIIMYH